MDAWVYDALTFYSRIGLKNALPRAAESVFTDPEKLVVPVQQSDVDARARIGARILQHSRTSEPAERMESSRRSVGRFLSLYHRADLGRDSANPEDGLRPRSGLSTIDNAVTGLTPPSPYVTLETARPRPTPHVMFA